MVISEGNSTLIPLYPSRSPRPPATRTKHAPAISDIPLASIPWNASVSTVNRSPAGTSGTKPSKGLVPAAEDANRSLARET